MSATELSPDEENAAPEAPVPSPGAILKVARERTGHGVDDIAAQLKLSRNTLEALERDDFAALSEPVYVRGYYRKVAKTLGVSEQEVLAAYDKLQPSGATPIRTPETPLPGGVEASIARRGQGQGLLIAGVIVLASVVALVMFSNPKRTEPLATQEPDAAPPPSAVTEATQPESAPAASASGGLDSAVATDAPAGPSAEPPVAEAPPTESATPPARAEVPVPEVAASAKPSQLVLQFSESSFVRIEDAGGKTLLIGLVRANEVPVLDGQPPYGVFLGNAGNVRVFHGGKSVDFSGAINSKNQTARFTVP